MNGRFAWGALLLAVFAAVGVGVLSYSAGVSHGLAIAPGVAAAPAAGAVPFAYYRPWGWGFGWGFGPLFFLGVWFMFAFMFRGLFWLGGYRRYGYGPGWREHAFTEWHRRAHEEMNRKP